MYASLGLSVNLDLGQAVNRAQPAVNGIVAAIPSIIVALGINVPGTARLCFDRREGALCHLSSRDFPSAERYDDDGGVRVLACPVTFREVAESAFAEIVRYGRTSVSVTCRLLEAIRNVGSCVTREAHRSVLLREAAAIASGVRDVSLSDSDRALIAQCRRAALDVLHEPPDDSLAAS